MMEMTHWVDYVIVGIVVLSIITGLLRGFVKELIALCVWIVAIWLAVYYTKPLAAYLESFIHDNTLRVGAAFVAILIGTLIAGAIVNALLSFVLHRSGLSGTDRILGMGFGFVRGVFIVGLLMVAVKMTGISDEAYRESSFLYPRFDPLVNWIYNKMPTMIDKIKLLENREALPKKVAIG